MPAKQTATPDRTGTEPDASSSLGRREQRRQQQLDLSRTQLLDAAEEVFGAKGFHDTTLREVAERAEFSVGTVYSFFSNKDDLFAHVLLRRGREMVPGMRQVAEGSGSGIDRLHALVDYEVGFFREHAHFGRLFLRTASTNRPAPELPVDELAAASEISENFDEAMRIQATLIEEGQRAGQVRAGDPYVLARLFSGLVSAFQAMDPAVVGSVEPASNGRAAPSARASGTKRGAGGDPAGGLSLEELHDIIQDAFGRG